MVQDLRGSTGYTIEVVTGTGAAFDRAFARLYEESLPPAGHFVVALGQAAQERAPGVEADRTFVVETRPALAELEGATARLRDLEQRSAEISQLLAGLRADWEDLRRHNRDVVAAVQALGVLQTQLVEAMAQLQAGQEALRARP